MSNNQDTTSGNQVYDLIEWGRLYHPPRQFYN